MEATAAHNQWEMDSLAAPTELRNPSSDIQESADWCTTILTSWPCKVKSFCRIRNHRNRGGWKTMPFIIGNETCEKLATIGLLSNMVVYLTKEFNMPNVTAFNVVNVWTGTTNLTPLLGAFLSDSYIGKFWTIALGCIASLIGTIVKCLRLSNIPVSIVKGMALLSLTAIFPHFRPPACSTAAGTPCKPATRSQNALLYSSFIVMTIGAAGIRPCSMAFGADQFDYTSQKGKRNIQSFFNWYYVSSAVAMMAALAIIVYIQDNVSWSWGLGIPAGLMFLSVTSFFLGEKLYILVTPEGSPFTSFLQVLVSAARKRHLSLSSQTSEYYDPPPTGVLKSRVVLTEQFMFLNKASIKTQEDLKEDGSVANPWRLCSLQQVEELKSVIRILPIWSGTISLSVCMQQLNTSFVLQAETMDRHFAKHFQIPAASFIIFTMLTLTLFLPIYDRCIVPFSRRMTKEGKGITLLQRMGLGLALATLSMAIAAAVETKRRSVALSHGFKEKHGDVILMSALWLVPQYSVVGLAEAFGLVGEFEFLYSQFPENMRSVAGALACLSTGLGSYVSSLILRIVHNTTGGRGHQKWVAQNRNEAKLDNFYWLLAGYSTINLAYFIVFARWYTYKTTVNDQAATTSLTEGCNPTLPDG